MTYQEFAAKERFKIHSALGHANTVGVKESVSPASGAICSTSTIMTLLPVLKAALAKGEANGR